MLQSTDVLDAAAARGDVDALVQWAVDRMIGATVPRDLPSARRALRRAVTIGHVDAALMEIAMTANGSGGAASWSSALDLLRVAAKGDHVAAAQLDLVERMAIDTDGRPLSPYPAQELASRPRIARIAGLFTPAECVHVATATRDLLAPADVIDPNTGRAIINPVRTSDAAVIGPTREDLIVRALNLRLAAISDTDVRRGEALTILRYAPGQQFRPHLDAIAGSRNQRGRTVLVYLNDGYDGGETSFPEIGLVVKPRAGDAIVFDNTLPDGRADPLSRHAGEPVTKGVKWLATRWIRDRSFDMWAGPESA